VGLFSGVRPVDGHVQGMRIMTASIVTPGTKLCNDGEFEAGHGVISHGGVLRASIFGEVQHLDGVISILANKQPPVPEIGDKVLCEISRLNEKNGEATLLVIEGKRGSIDAENLIAQFHVTNITDRYLHQTRDALNIRDICRGVVIETKPVLRIDFRSSSELGVLSTICGACGGDMKIKLDDDWNVACTVCNTKDFRAVSDQFGVGWGTGREDIDEVSRKGKRWSEATEKFRNIGPSARATRIAADVRNDGREIEYFSFEGGSSGGGGAKQQADPDCRLFVGGIPRDIDTNGLREIFGEYGEMDDCIVMTDESGNSRGFGFVTYEHKDMAQAAIQAMKTKKVQGRILGVNLADDKSKKDKPKSIPEVKFYVGNLPFSITEEQIRSLFKDKAEITHINIVTGPDNKPKGFAFVSTTSETNADELVGQITNTEIDGRKIRIDVAGQTGKKSNKSSRELRAMLEEEQDGKKKRHRPRKEKKD